MAKYAAKGTQLQLDDGDGNFATLAHLMTIDGPGGDTEQLDMTDHDSSGFFREFLPSFKDPGEIGFTAHYDPDDATHEELAALWNSGETRAWRIVLPGFGGNVLFDAWVRNISISNPFDGSGGLSGTLRITGPVTFPAADYASL